MSRKKTAHEPAAVAGGRRGPSRRSPSFDHGLAGFWLWLAIAALTITVYAPVWNFGFISLDDPQYVSANPMVARGVSWAGVRWAFAGGNGFYWHPLTWLSHQIDVQLFGMDAGSHHMMSLLIHVLNSLLLFLVFVRMTAATGRSAFVAAIFALHPLHVESVAWIAERKDVLSTLFALLATLAYVRYAQLPRVRRLMPVMLFFVCGLMAKPMIVTLPIVFLLLDYWPLQRAEARTGLRSWLPLIKEKLPLFCLSIGASAVTVLAQRQVGAVIPLTGLSLYDRLANALVAYVTYARDALWPARLAVFYPLQVPGAVLAASALLLVASTLGVAWWLRRRAPSVLVGTLWYLITLLPVIGIVQAGAQGRADRFTYVPLIGLSVIVAWGLADLALKLRVSKPALGLAAVALVATCAAATRVQLGYWQSNVALWGRALAVTSRNYLAEDRLGVALSDAGRLDLAVEHYAAALAIWPEFPEAHNNLGTSRVDQGRGEDAIREFAEAVRIRPNEPMFHYNLAVVLNNAGRTSEAVREMKAALRLRPGDSSFARALSVIADRPGK